MKDLLDAVALLRADLRKLHEAGGTELLPDFKLVAYQERLTQIMGVLRTLDALGRSGRAG